MAISPPINRETIVGAIAAFSVVLFQVTLNLWEWPAKKYLVP